MTYKIMNDLVFKYVYGQDTLTSKRALKGLLETFLELKIKEVEIKNTNVPARNIRSKDSRFDVMAQLDNHTMIDIEMQMESTTDSLTNRLESYSAKMLSNQDQKGKMYRDLKPCYVLIFTDANIYDDDYMIKTFQFRSEYDTLLSPNSLSHIIIVEMKKLRISDKMSLKEEYVYYLKNCQNAQNDSKIKSILEHVEVIRMADKCLNEITDEYWQTLNKEFDELKKNENEVREKYYQDKYRDEGRAEERSEMIHTLSQSMSVQQIASALGKSVNEIENILGQTSV